MNDTGQSMDLSRRRFLGGAVAAGVGTLVVADAAPAVAQGAMPIQLPPLPYPDTALAPHDTRLSRDEIDYVSTHATSTVLGDKAESKSIRRVFGGRPVPVSALKSMTGHMLAPSAPFEIACALMCMREGVIPPTANLSEKDPSCDVAAASATRESADTTALCNSFGFGGINAVVVKEVRIVTGECGASPAGAVMHATTWRRHLPGDTHLAPFVDETDKNYISGKDRFFIQKTS